TVYVSAVTITIRFTGSDGQQHDVYWLEKQLAGYEERPGGTELLYRNGDGETERLIITDQALVGEIKKHLGHNRHIGRPHQRVMRSAGSKILVVLGVLVALFLTVYLWFVPWLGEKVAM